MRGENRNTVAESADNLIVRRVVASRCKPTDSSILEYKIQWETSWESASEIKGSAVQEWQDALDGKETFTYRAQDGGKWTVLKDSHKRENDSEDLQWEMWLAIRRNVIAEVKKDWFSGIQETDFIFANDGEEIKALCEAERHDLPQPTSALAVFQTAWQHLAQSSHLQDSRIIYGDVEVLFIAELDPVCNNDSDAPHEMHRPALTVADTVQLLHDGPFDSLDEQAFNKSDGARSYDNFAHWCEVTKQLIRQVPYMFRTGTWTQLLALLLLGSNNFEAELASVGIEVKDDWCMRAKEYAMHMYYDWIVDDRPIHDIQETFLSLRDFFRGLKSDDDGKETEYPEVTKPATEEHHVTTLETEASLSSLEALSAIQCRASESLVRIEKRPSQAFEHNDANSIAIAGPYETVTGSENSLEPCYSSSGLRAIECYAETLSHDQGGLNLKDESTYSPMDMDLDIDFPNLGPSI
jgi:hypothetical protein